MDTLDRHCVSLDGNRYAQVIAKGHFSKIYPMDSKRQAGDTLREFAKSLESLRGLLLIDPKNSVAREEPS